jgi:hypothetical protein
LYFNQTIDKSQLERHNSDDDDNDDDGGGGDYDKQLPLNFRTLVVYNISHRI